MAETAVESDQLVFSFDELMTEDAYEEPLITGGVRCHGGYIGGKYVSPRGAVRRRAIANWHRRLAADGLPVVVVPDKYVPPSYPNYPQAKFLLTEGVVDPLTRALTIISIVEGFGARIREVQLPDFDREIKESIDGTSLAHLGSGLFEAHARDEAGHRDQGGHKQMWEAARDVGLDKPDIPNDVLLRLMTGGSRGERKRAFPELSERMEGMITMMANVLIIETFADNTFTWAKQLLGDPEVSADAERAAHIVDCIARDEVPHVDYLTVALSELRGHTLCSPDGTFAIPGSEVIDTIFRGQLRGMATQRPRENRERLRTEIRQAIADESRATRIARTFEDLDAGWEFPHADDEELDILLSPA
ncbi:MAG: hypothetical protein E2O54_06995 [Gammaproteobacteria bacterium]|nr:MAG: hypothetical protein E2O58_11610 [Gammaproteobacteria bacterium]TDJ40796.1 MAG: hypothetical protein E2O54_06995 [Gammaproteobacteria bacterium]